VGPIGNVTIYDIAKAAQVSPTTVSRALNGSTLVREETRARVLLVAEKMGYEMPKVSPSPTRAKALNVSVVISDVLNPHIMRVVKGIHSVLAPNGASMHLFEHDGRREDEMAYLSSLKQRGIDGLLLSTPHLESRHFLLIRQAGIPAVIFSSSATGAADVPTVGVNNLEAACQAMLHLYRLGHTRIGIIRGPMGDLTNSEERLEGCRVAALSQGLELDFSLVKEGDFTIEGGYEAALSLLDVAEPPTAIFAFSDTMALGAIAAAKERGIPVPERLSIVGFDDIPLAAWSDPPLTTISQPAALIGQRAAELLLDVMAGKAVEELRIRLPYELVERGSTAPPAGVQMTRRGS